MNAKTVVPSGHAGVRRVPYLADMDEAWVRAAVRRGRALCLRARGLRFLAAAEVGRAQAQREEAWAGRELSKLIRQESHERLLSCRHELRAAREGLRSPPGRTTE